MSTSSTQRTATLTLMGICVASLVFSQVRSLTDVESALKSEGLSEHRARELLAASVPVGGVIPYFGNLPLPPNWQLCDGSDLRLDADVGLRLRLSGKTPDLRRRFLYGASSTNETGITGGLSQASVNLGSTADDGRHAHSVPHSHRLPSLTGPISQATPSPTPFVAIWGHRLKLEAQISKPIRPQTTRKASTCTTSVARPSRPTPPQVRRVHTGMKWARSTSPRYLPLFNVCTPSESIKRRRETGASGSIWVLRVTLPRAIRISLIAKSETRGKASRQ